MKSRNPVRENTYYYDDFVSKLVEVRNMIDDMDSLVEKIKDERDDYKWWAEQEEEKVNSLTEDLEYANDQIDELKVEIQELEKRDQNHIPV
jgi:chromosome segregation ATPase